MTESFITVDNNFHDMFCAGISTLESGVIVASGGNPSDRSTSSFDPVTLSWSPLADMNDRPLNRRGATGICINSAMMPSRLKLAANLRSGFPPSRAAR